MTNIQVQIASTVIVCENIDIKDLDYLISFFTPNMFNYILSVIIYSNIYNL